MRYAAQGKDGALFWAERGVGYVVSGAVDRDRLTQIAQAGLRPEPRKTAAEATRVQRDVPIRTLKIWNQTMGASHYRTG